jgi:uncharacterized protein
VTVRLRAHHLLCLLTYAGKGYNSAFTANYDLIAKRIEAGEDIEIVAGPDDICAPLLDDPQAHCRRDSVSQRDDRAASAVAALLSQPVVPGARLRIGKDWTHHMRGEFARGNIRAACEGCEWHDLCTEIAEAGYRNTRLFDPAAS